MFNVGGSTMDKIIYITRFLEEGIFMCKKLKELQGKKPIELLEEYDMSDIIPVDVNKLLDKMHIKTYPIDYERIEKMPSIVPFVEQKGKILGTVMLNNDDIVITYRKSDPIHRKRFTVAHELAHCCLGDNFGEKFIQFRNDLVSNADEMERKCNIFAGELLIPEHIIRNLHKSVNIFPLERLSQIFDVSESVMAKRLDILEIPYIKMNGGLI